MIDKLKIEVAFSRQYKNTNAIILTVGCQVKPIAIAQQEKDTPFP